ncbi:15083_t:CDS:2 [Cetraspora pellucida]|uniref:15083_t:CDS:1 n=1 Tax=Cetraspora pellucida TaxID=1433469 RepID=A0A9N8ZC54_9GLOM|nr:15083_t:CDS:2 [Cetraspora pellucida]
MEISRPVKWTVGNNSQNTSTHSQINRTDQRNMIEMNGENSQRIDGTDSDATIETWYENEYVVEKVVGHRLANGRLQYYLKWKDYPDEENTWEDESDIFATNLIDEYWDKKGGRPMTNTSSSSCSSAVVSNRRRRRYRYNAKDNDGDTLMIGSTSYDDNDENQTKSSRHKNSSISQREYDDGYLANYKPVPAMPRHNNGYGRPSVSNSEIEEERWEDIVQRVETVERDKDSKELLVYIKWVNGSRSCHKASVANKKCPQAVIEFYENHLKFHEENEEI